MCRRRGASADYVSLCNDILIVVDYIYIYTHVVI